MIGDTLSAKGIAWAWYAGAWNWALAYGMQPPDVKRSMTYTFKPGTVNFQAYHQPFNYFARIRVAPQRHIILGCTSRWGASGSLAFHRVGAAVFAPTR